MNQKSKIKEFRGKKGTWELILRSFFFVHPTFCLIFRGIYGLEETRHGKVKGFWDSTSHERGAFVRKWAEISTRPDLSSLLSARCRAQYSGFQVNSYTGQHIHASSASNQPSPLKIEIIR
ncbi:hypothetical protein ACLOJK_003345 [Asimina triloba]